METTDLEKFDPTREMLTKMVEKTKTIITVDLSDKAQLETVRTNRIELKTARVQIEKTGKGIREDALKYQKAVIAKEKELISIIEPEEVRLAQIEADAEALVIRMERMEKLPARKARIEALGAEFITNEEHLLSMDANAFEAFYNTSHAIKLAADAAKAAKAQREKDEQTRKENDAKAAELNAKEAALEESRLENEREASRLRAEKEAREREDADRDAESAKAAEDARTAEIARQEAEAKEKATLAKREEYKKFRADLGWSEDKKAMYKEENTGKEIVLWIKMGTFTL